MSDETRVKKQVRKIADSEATFSITGGGYETKLGPGGICYIGGSLDCQLPLAEDGVSSVHALVHIQRSPRIHQGIPHVYDLSKYGTFPVKNGVPLFNGVALRDSPNAERVSVDEVKGLLRAACAGEVIEQRHLDLLMKPGSSLHMENRFAEYACINCSTKFTQNPEFYADAKKIPHTERMAVESCPNGHQLKPLESLSKEDRYAEKKEDFFMLKGKNGEEKFARTSVAKHPLEGMLAEGTMYHPLKVATLRLVDPKSPRIEVTLRAIRF